MAKFEAISLLSKWFKEVWLCDFEFSAPPGELPLVVCMVAREFFSGRTLRLWRHELLSLRHPPFAIDGDVLFVAYYASAEIGCFRALGWPMPANILDLFIEFRCLTNGLSPAGGNGLVGALQYHGLPSIDAIEKDAMRQLAMRGGDYTDAEQQALLDYCESDVVALQRLLPKMMPIIDRPRALLRGQYMTAAARIEQNGIPIDTSLLKKLQICWKDIQDALIQRVDVDYGVYEGRTFKANKFSLYLQKRNITWPILPSGKLDLKDSTFKEMATLYPELTPLKELRATLGGMRLFPARRRRRRAQPMPAIRLQGEHRAKPAEQCGVCLRSRRLDAQPDKVWRGLWCGLY